MSTPDHPRPQLVRPSWQSLDGPWDYAADRDGQWTRPADVDWSPSRTITVPYAPETPASGINDPAACRDHWYRRTVAVPAECRGEEGAGDKRLLIHFQAVDYSAVVFVDGAHVAEDEGGYLPFTVDLTPHAKGKSELEIVVHAIDDPYSLSQPRGKQHWGEQPGGIFYERTSGIWQTVWLEVVPRIAISELIWDGDLDALEARFHIKFTAPAPGAWLTVNLTLDGRPAGAIQTQVPGHEVLGRVSLAAAGLTKTDVAWSPERPALLDATIELRSREEGELLDGVTSYLGVRKFEARDGRFFLNGEEVYLSMPLDQGYWPETGLTPPNTEALKLDVELAKAMGFNAVRKHMKIEDPRWHYWADHLGLMLWSELPACFVFTPEAIQRTMDLFAGSIVRDRSHPCIIAWIPINEAWGVPDLENDMRQRAFVKALMNIAKALDGTRPVSSCDGWQSVGGDIHGIHEYEFEPEKLGQAFAGPQVPPTGVGRPTIVEPPEPGAPVVLSEWGGVSIVDAGDETYRDVVDADALAAHLTKAYSALRQSTLLAGNCYTQFTDTWQEANGLLFMDRTPKIPLDVIYEFVTGKAPDRPSTPTAAEPEVKVEAEAEAGTDTDDAAAGIGSTPKPKPRKKP